jgi:hypothetical protein
MGGRRHGAKVSRAQRRRQPPYRPDETKKRSRSIPPPQAVDHLLTILSREERRSNEHSKTS